MSVLKISEKLSLPRDAITQTLVVYGGRGSGKTNFGSVFAEELSHSGLRFSVIDPMGVWFGLRYAADGASPGIEVLMLGGVHGDLPIEPSGGAVIADLVVDEDVSVVIDISRHKNGAMWTLAERIRFVTSYIVRLYERQGQTRRPLMQIIDEAARFVPQLIPHGAANLSACVAAIEQLAEEGRNIGVGLCLITQRSARMNKSVSELAECMVAFRIIGPNSTEAVLDWFGSHIVKSRHKELLEALRKLPVGRALIVSPGWLGFEDEVQIRPRQTFDSSRTPKPGEKAKQLKHGAAPDLEKYRQRMAETIEHALAHDPQELQRQLRAQRQETEKLQLQNRQLLEKLEMEKQNNKLLEPVQILTDEDREQLDTMLEKINEILAEVPGIAAAMAEIMTRVPTPSLAGNDKRDITSGSMPDEVSKRMFEPFGEGAAEKEFKIPKHIATMLDMPHGNDAVLLPDAVFLPSGEKRCLISVAQKRGPVEREYVSIMTGFKRSTRDAYIARLKEKGFVIIDNGLVRATREGIEALGQDYEPLPTGDALRAYWRVTLPLGESVILQELMNVYPIGLAREKLSELTNFKRSTRDAYISRLQTRKLVTASLGSPVKAADELFN